MNRNAAVRQFLVEILRSQQNTNQNEPTRIKLLLGQAILEGSLELALNPKLLTPASNGFSDHSEGGEAVYLTDVAIRPLSDPEVHVGLNELELFLDVVQGIIGPLPRPLI